MNLNAIRKNYETLTSIERHALMISALQRDDKSEIDAIYAATPRKTYSQIDFYELKQSLLVLQMFVMIVKADYFNTALMLSEVERPKHKGIDRLSLYFFFTVADAWKAVCKEIGIDADAFEKMLFPNHCVTYRLAEFENSFRGLAFTEAAAAAFCKKHYQLDGTLAFTLENEIAGFRKFLDLPGK